MKKLLTGLGGEFLDLLYPSDIKCLLCGEELDGKAKNGFCEACFALLPFNSGKVCLCCGSALHDLSSYCNRCQKTSFAFDLARSAFVYEGVMPPLIYGLKFGGKRYFAPAFARFLVQTLSDCGLSYDLVVPVPLHQKRLKSRGYNQAQELAKELCILLDCQTLLRTDLLVKTVHTSEQAKKSAVSRWEALKNSFAVTDQSVLKGKKILLVDDVLTTGATAHYCAEALKNGGAAAVFVLSLASTKYHPVLETSDIKSK